MQNKIDATLSTTDRDKIIQFIDQIKALLPFLTDLTPEERHSLVKMGDSGRPFVQQSLTLVEQDDTFMPRTFDKTEMRADMDLYESMLPVVVRLTQLFEAVNDTMLLTGSDLIMAGLDVYRNAKSNGTGENLDSLVPLIGKRFKRKTKKGGDDGNESPSG